MSVFEITIQRKDEDAWPVVVRHQPGAHELALWSRGRLDLDLEALAPLPPSDKAYGRLLGEALFRDDIRDAFVRAVADAKAANEPLRVLLNVEADDLRRLHWEQLHAPLDRGWDYLLLNQGTPFSLYLPSQIRLRFPPIGRRDLRALVLVAGPEELNGDYGLAPFDVPATVGSIQHALGEISSDVLARVEGAIGPPTLNDLCEHLTAGRYTLLHVVCHGRVIADSGETVLYFPGDENRRPVSATTLIEQLGRLDRLPHFTFLSTCESADPQAEAGLGGLGQRLVRELGMPAVLAMTDRISIKTAGALASAFYACLREHGEVDRALCEALVGLQGRYDVTVPALFSRLGGCALWSDTLDRPLTDAEIRYGLEQLPGLLEQRAPVLLPEFRDHSTRILASLGAEAAALSTETRRERDAALASVNQLCSEALDLSFNALALGQSLPAYDGRCPFRGLFPFRAEDREFFFGRQALVDKLTARLGEHGFLAVLGPSGSGKSSLVLAGLVPALQADEPQLRMAYLTPGSEPLSQLEAALAEAGTEDGRPDLVVVDQFEELFTLCRDQDERQAFVERLLSLSDRSRIVITMRADFWGECAAFPGLKNEMQAHQELVAPMDAAALRRATERQADHVGLRFEAGLGEEILNDVEGEPGVMPLLQHALLLLWQRRHGRWLHWKQYRATGGIRQAIAHTADEVYLGLTEHEQERMRDIFLRLTRLEDEPGGPEARDTRRRVSLAELVPAGREPTDTMTLVKRLADARLVVTSLNAASGQEEVEVAHEALICHWPRLRTWLDEDRTGLQLRQDLREAALDWQASNQDDAYLSHRGGRLEDAEALRRQPRFALNELEQTYVEACVDLRERERREKEEQQRRKLEAARELAAEQQARAEEQAANAARMRRRAVVIGVVGIVALVLAALSMLFWQQAKNSARQAGDNAATATANLAKAITNEAEADTQRSFALTSEAAANVSSTRAVASAATAQANAEIAHARELAALSTSQLDARLDRAFLLSIEAFRQESLPQTRQALLQSWNHNPQLSRYLHGHAHMVTSVAWSADGRLASGSWDGTIIVWDLERGRPAQTLEGHAGQVESVAWSADGRLASGSRDNSVIIWDLERGRPAQTLEGHADEVHGVSWSADGRLASSSWDGTVIVWDLERGRPAQTLEEYQRWFTSVAWSADGLLASGSWDGAVVVWDLAKAGLELDYPAQILEGHAGEVWSVAWSTDGQLASGSWDGTVIIWDLERGRPTQTLEGFQRWITNVAWSAEGRLASGSWDRTVIVWDLERGRPAQTLEGHAGSVWSVAWSAEGRLASGSSDRTVILWELEQSRLAQTLEGHTDSVWSVAWSAEGRLASGALDNTVIIWDLENARPAQILEGQAGEVWSVAWSTDGQLASGTGDGTVIIWDPERGWPAQTLRGHAGGVWSVAWSADGQLASASWDGTIIVWNLERGRPAQTLEGHAGEVWSVAWSADGQLASGSRDGTVIVWDLERGRPAQTLEGHADSIWSVAWSADGRLASGSTDSTIIVWDLARGRPAQTLEGHAGEVYSVAWSADGQLASGSPDRCVIIWDLERGRPAQTLKGYRDYVNSVAWSADGRLASSTEDDTVQVWMMDPEEWIRQACDRAGRNLTKTEWWLYFPGDDYRKTCDQWPAGE